MRGHNIREDVVLDVLDDTLKKMPNFGQCDHPKIDAA